ncbi:MAG: DUF1592 domain-containing protein [Gemmataceae bacterium]
MVRFVAVVAVGTATLASFAGGWYCAVSGRTVAAPVAVASQPPAPAAQPKAVAPVAKDDPAFKDKVLPFLNKYCNGCHNSDKAAGGLALDGYRSEAEARKNRKDWGAVQHALASGDMPPKKKEQPTKEEREFVIGWIETALTKVDCGLNRDPGRVTLRRLNRAEYNNTVRDLCGVTVRPADDFPADDVGYGFDNIGDVLSFQPILLEKYMTAAEQVLAAALNGPAPIKQDKQTNRAQAIQTIPREAKKKDGPKGQPRIVFTSEGSAYLERYNFPAAGEYALRLKAWGTTVAGEAPKVVFRVDGKDVHTTTVSAPADKAQVYEVKTKLPAGEKRVAFAFVNPKEDKERNVSREFGVESIEIEGPIGYVDTNVPAGQKLLLVARPTGPADARQAAEKVLTNFARRAYRRPATPEETQRLLRLYDAATTRGDAWEQAIRLPMKAVLCSPHFLYRIEDDPENPEGVRTLNDWEFATRLSYFLWSTMPDEELFRLAGANELRKPEVLEAQVQRMIRDPKARALSENFAGQWLQLRNIRTLAPDKGFFPKWDEALRAGMIGEAEAFFEYVVQNDRSALEFVDADYTFVNARMAEHYGIPGDFGKAFRRVTLPDNKRGGIITMASTLTVTSNPTRTSPVKRGKWILENILGTPPPPPAPDVPELPPTGQLKGTLRQQMEQHRENPSCAGCHSRLDPLGFGLENFDGIGGWRAQDNKQAIDSSGVLPDGAKFNGPAELRKVLVGKSDQFRRCFADKLLTFALGRGLEYYDKCALDDIVTRARGSQDRFSAYVLAVVTSDPFQKRKGRRSE